MGIIVILREEQVRSPRCLLFRDLSNSSNNPSPPIILELLHYRLGLALIIVHDDVHAFVEFDLRLTDVSNTPITEEGDAAPLEVAG